MMRRSKRQPRRRSKFLETLTTGLINWARKFDKASQAAPFPLSLPTRLE